MISNVIEKIKRVSFAHILLATSMSNRSQIEDRYDFNNLLMVENLTKSKIKVKDRLSAMGRSTYGPQKLHRKR